MTTDRSAEPSLAARTSQLPGGEGALGGLANRWYIACPTSRLPGEFKVGGNSLRIDRPPGGGIQSPDAQVAESEGYIWAWHGDGSPGNRPPPIATMARKGYAYTQLSIPVAADWRLVLDNSLDFAHGPFVHPWTQPAWFLHAFRPRLEARYRATADGLHVDAFLGGLRVFEHAFTLPDRLRLVVAPDLPWPVDITVHHVPEGPGRTRMEVLVGRRKLPWESPKPRYRKGSFKVHRQDIVILEAQQLAWQSQSPTTEQHCAADAYTLLLRRVLEAAANGSWDPGDFVTSRTIAFRF